MNNSSMIIGPKLLKAFGLSADGVRRFSIKCDVNELVELKVTYVGTLNKDTKELEETIKTFKMVEK